MNFHGRAHRDEPEINLIAFIDILLAVGGKVGGAAAGLGQAASPPS